MTAAAFDITKAKDEFGQDIEPVNEFSAGLVRRVIVYYLWLIEGLMEFNLSNFSTLSLKPPDTVQVHHKAPFR